ncbi:hypothetical protein [Micromonospora sp. L32]|uniref:hypothetical protein n=1 Tax=unclassified Micromonospora TaxID=2617518 RepID=UPI003F88EBFA
MWQNPNQSHQGPRTLPVAIDSAAVLPGRTLQLDTLELGADRVVLRYRACPGFSVAELREHGRRSYAWQAFLEDDLGTDYFYGFSTGGFSTDEPITTGDRSTNIPVPSGARFLALSIYTARLPEQPYGRPVLAVFLPVQPSGTAETLGAAAETLPAAAEELEYYRSARRAGLRSLLRSIARGAEILEPPAGVVAEGHQRAWLHALAAHGLIERHAGRWRVTSSGEAAVDAANVYPLG